MSTRGRDANLNFKHLSTSSTSRVLVDLGSDWMIIVLAYLFYFRFPRVPSFILLIVISGIEWHRLAVLGHDAIHFLLFKRRAVNDFIANLFCFYPLMVTVTGFRTFHFEHHRSLGTSRDPELKIKKGRLYSRPLLRRQFALVALLDSIGFGSTELVQFIWYSMPVKKRDLVGLAMFWAAAAVLFWHLNLLRIVFFHFLSLFTSFWIVFRIRNWSEHTGIEDTYRFKCNWLWRYSCFPHNTWCHFEHHKWSSIPYLNLPKARAFDKATPILSISQLFDFFGRTGGPGTL